MPMVKLIYQSHQKLRTMLLGAFGPPIAAYGFFVVGLIIMPVLPDDVTSRYAVADRYADWVGSWIPMVDHIAALSRFPEVAKLYLALMWGIVPAWVYMLFQVQEDRLISYEYHARHKIFFIFAYLVFLPMLVYFSVIFPVTSYADLPTLMKWAVSSRFGMVMIGTIFPACVAYSVYSIVLWAKRIPRLYLGKPT